MKWLHEQWLRLPLNIRKGVVSFTKTFLAIFCAAMVFGLTEGPMINSKEALVALLIAAMRTALSAGWNEIAQYTEK